MSEETLPTLEELLAKLRERYGIREVGVRATVGFRVPVEVSIAYKTLKPEVREALRERLERVIALAALGYLDREDIPIALMYSPEYAYKLKRLARDERGEPAQP